MKRNVVHKKSLANISIKLIRDPLNNLAQKDAQLLLAECANLAEVGWGKFNDEYLKTNTLDSHYLCLLRDESGRLIGMAPLKKLRLRGRIVYSIGLVVVDPEYRGSSLMNKMSSVLLRKAFIECILRGKLFLELIFITPNIRTMGTIAKIATFIYPNPNSYDEKTKRIPDPDSETAATVAEYLKVSNEKYRKFIKNGSIMEGFYDDKEHLIIKETSHVNKKLHDFAQEYIYSVPGRELVVRAVISIWSVFSREY